MTASTSLLTCRPAAPSRDGRYASTQWASVDWRPSRQSTSLGCYVAQDQLHRCTRIRCGAGKDPPKWADEPMQVSYRWRFLTSGDSISSEVVNQLRRKPVSRRQSRGPHRWRADTAFAPGVDAHVYQQRPSEYWRGTTGQSAGKGAPSLATGQSTVDRRHIQACRVDRSDVRYGELTAPHLAFDLDVLGGKASEITELLVPDGINDITGDEYVLRALLDATPHAILAGHGHHVGSRVHVTPPTHAVANLSTRGQRHRSFPPGAVPDHQSHPNPRRCESEAQDRATHQTIGRVMRSG